eukprot:CAMPEP_0171105076 /NCGR_PEP_ID=MMETSP0766_2-20121228/61920_1 /TAXON_ID=439317 /ORGANISM="Gambierdiscus australes, Strain CAWD 149" /LENGTH=86 /DNA_ID=CAMNT_0011565825 /DNA_START=222 /DNA_END=483 /DNA_ORIENTATION=-
MAERAWNLVRYLGSHKPPQLLPGVGLHPFGQVLPQLLARAEPLPSLLGVSARMAEGFRRVAAPTATPLPRLQGAAAEAKSSTPNKG